MLEIPVDILLYKDQLCVVNYFRFVQNWRIWEL